MIKTATATVECPTCCGGAKCTQLECRKRGGEVQLCGFPEYPGYESTPPRFYLEKEFGGSSSVCTCVVECVKPSPDVFSCAVLRTVAANGCTYGATLTLDSIYQVGGVYKCDVTVVLNTAPGGKCPEAVPYASVTGAYFVFGSGFRPGAHKGTGVCYGDFTCVGSARTGGFAAASVSLDIPGVPSYPSCAVTSYFAYDSVITSTVVEYSGSVLYDPMVDCFEPGSSTGKRTVAECKGFTCVSSLGACGTPTEISVDSAFIDDTYLNTFLSVKETTSTMIWQHTPYDCSAGLGSAAKDGSERYEQLNREDTEEDALARLLAGPGGVWGAWLVVLDGTGGTCANPDCCQAEWQIRTDRTFAYFETEYRGRISGLAPASTVDITIRVYRRPWGSLAPFVLFQDLEFDDVVADGAGDAIVTGAVPNAEGFETYVRCVAAPEPPPGP